MIERGMVGHGSRAKSSKNISRVAKMSDRELSALSKSVMIKNRAPIAWIRGPRAP